MEKIPLPDSVTVTREEGNEATFEVSPYYPGYGPTMGNALRRVLLSSLPGAAVTAVHIDGVDHEFSTIPGVKEDMISLLLNLKQLRLKVHRDEPVELTLKAKGEMVVKAKDFEKHADVDVANPDLTIATLTDAKAELSLRATAQRGRGYVPIEQREDEDRALGEVAVDAIYTPVERVSFHVENVRVGQATEFHKLILTIRTDGTISPREALSQAAAILEDHYKVLVEDLKERLTFRRETPVSEAKAPAGVLPPPGADRDLLVQAELAPAEERLVSEEVMGAVRAPDEKKAREAKALPILQFPVNTRVQNVLEREGIRTVAGLTQKTRAQLLAMEGLGEKAVQEIEVALAEMHVTLREEKGE